LIAYAFDFPAWHDVQGTGLKEKVPENWRMGDTAKNAKRAFSRNMSAREGQPGALHFVSLIEP
jgi:hypothetical protein